MQYPEEELKTEMSRTTVPIADTLVKVLSEQVRRWPGETVLTAGEGEQVGPWKIEREVRRVRKHVACLPGDFRFQDLRHYFASLLISSGADVRTVQRRLRHASAKTTLDAYGHSGPDTEESTRTAVEAVMSAEFGDFADSVRTHGS
ncbi:tyrosine-type recombinase/integrase [Actinopolyspora alba]|uniref:tyrosine-type recombinase/integrase n=1 Tax=Actinopolyspora alba TaxID=673379 RepID=UPI000B88CC23|nr:tyrosine-type recombinase/integrase [Actinopolyspora alba]